MGEEFLVYAIKKAGLVILFLLPALTVLALAGLAPDRQTARQSGDSKGTATHTVGTDTSGPTAEPSRRRTTDSSPTTEPATPNTNSGLPAGRPKLGPLETRALEFEKAFITPASEEDRHEAIKPYVTEAYLAYYAPVGDTSRTDALSDDVTVIFDDELSIVNVEEEGPNEAHVDVCANYTLLRGGEVVEDFENVCFIHSIVMQRIDGQWLVADETL